jgi:hypothetical protein
VTRKHKEREEVFAILRHDELQGSDAPIDERVTVKEVVASVELAVQEVARLNELNNGKGCTYWYQQTRLFPEGRSAGPDVG